MLDSIYYNTLNERLLLFLPGRIKTGSVILTSTTAVAISNSWTLALWNPHLMHSTSLMKRGKDALSKAMQEFSFTCRQQHWQKKRQQLISDVTWGCSSDSSAPKHLSKHARYNIPMPTGWSQAEQFYSGRWEISLDSTSEGHRHSGLKGWDANLALLCPVCWYLIFCHRCDWLSWII